MSRRSVAEKRTTKRKGTGKTTTSRRGPDPAEDEIYRLITLAIVTKHLRPGNRLKEAGLAQQFDVSRPRVRRVLERLADLDIVEFQLNRGALIKRPTPDEALAVLSTRRVLEAEAVRAAAQRASPADFVRLRKSVDEESRAFAQQDKTVAVLSSEFHIELGKLSGNTVLARTLSQLVHRSVLIQSLYERQGQHAICLVHEHAAIIDLMEQRNPVGAVETMQQHLEHIESSLDFGAAATLDERLALSIG